jgi:S1-C subfamily serine protease
MPLPSRVLSGVALVILASVLAPLPARAQVATVDPGASEARIENSVVQVFATLREPDPLRPWTKQAPREVTGTGVVIDGKRILTNAHVVTYASLVEVQANHAGDKVSATVEAIAPGIDLAILKLEDAGFFDTHPPLQRAPSLPSVRDAVMAYGFPSGGTSLSITKGIVSRIEFAPYSASTSGLRIQIDAAINPGNSGGPAVAGERMIGLVFSSLGGAQNIGYIIPCEEIELFLADVADGHYDGKPAMFDEIQTLENEALRASLKVPKSMEGVVAHRPFSTEPTYPLRQWDLITRIGDTRIDDQGMVALASGPRVRFKYLVQKATRAGKVPLTVWRSGKELLIELPVGSVYPVLIPDLAGEYPPYFIFGPLVLSTATAQFLSSAGGGGNSAGMLGLFTSPLITRRMDRPAFPDEELVVVSSPFLPHRLAKGYGSPAGRVVKTVNGIPIRNLRHLVEVLRDSREAFVTFELLGRFGEDLVFPRKETLAATEEILGDNGIRSQGSPDVLAVWSEKTRTASAP